MKLEELYAVYMSVPESAGRNVYDSNIIEVFVDKDDAETLADDIRYLVATHWGWDINTIPQHDKDLVMNSAQVITLEEAMMKVIDDAFDNGTYCDPHH